MPLNIRLLTLMLLGAISPGRGQDPKINFIEPCAAAPGKATRVILHGDNIETNWAL